MRRKMIALLLAAYMCLSAGICTTSTAAEVSALNEEDSFKIVQNSDGSCTLTSEPLDNEALYDRYVDELFGIADDSANEKLPVSSGRITRDEVTEAVIKLLGKYIGEVAEGTRTNTKFYMTYDELSQYVSDRQLIEQWDHKENGKYIFGSCLADYDPQMYWFDTSAGLTYNKNKYTVVEGSDPVDCVYFGFRVIPLYSVTGEKGTFDVNPEVSATAHIAISNAREIVKKYTRNDTMYSDYFVLKSFKDEIQSLATYDHDAADNYDNGHPSHQMLNVFDGDPTTNVVCEGFSRAFKFLCDNYKFHSKVTCESVCGMFYYPGGGGGHMWNLVQIGTKEDNRYLVDVTNDRPGQDLFMVGTSNAHYGSGDDVWYSFPNGLKYSYDRKGDSRMEAFSNDELKIFSRKKIPVVTCKWVDQYGNYIQTRNNVGHGETVTFEGKHPESDDPSYKLVRWEYDEDRSTNSICVFKPVFEKKTVKVNYIGGRYKVYDGTPAKPIYDLEQDTGENASIMYGTEKGKYTLTEMPSYKDAGNYEVYYKATYKDYTPVESTCYIIIDKAKNSWTTTPSISNVFVADAPAVPKGAAKLGSVRFTYSDSENGTFTTTAPTKPGEYYMKAEVKETNNYYGLSKVIKYKILDKITSIEYFSDVERAYDGTPQTIDPLNFGSEYTVTYGKSLKDCDNKEPQTYVDPGLYNIYFKITRSDGTSYTDHINLHIIKKDDEWTEYPNIESWMYGEEPNAPTGKAKYGKVEFTYCSRYQNTAYTTEVPTEPGQYWMRAEIASTEKSNGRRCWIPFSILTEDSIAKEDDSGEMEFTASADNAEKPKKKTNEWIIAPYVNISAMDDPMVHTFGKAKYGEIEFSYSYRDPKTKEYGEYTTQEPTFVGYYRVKATVNAEGCKPLEKIIYTSSETLYGYPFGGYRLHKIVAYDGKPHKAEEPPHDDLEGYWIKYGTKVLTYDLDTPPEYTEPGTYIVYWQINSTNVSSKYGWTILEIVDNGSAEAPTKGIYGDVDRDGTITANDALMILRQSVGMEDSDSELIFIADVDGDGEVTANDALAVLRYSVGMNDDNLVGKPVN